MPDSLSSPALNDDTDDVRPARSKAHVTWTGRIAGYLAASVLLAWLMGRIVSDRYLWSQYLLWIPTQAAFLTAVIGFAAALRPDRSTRRRWRRIVVWTTINAAILAYFSFFEYHFWRDADLQTEGLRITQWTMSHAKTAPDANARLIVRHAGDITILSDSYGVRWDQITPKLDESGIELVRIGHYKILSRIPVLEAREIVAGEGARIAFIRLDASAALARELTIYLVDLPSDPAIARAEQARRVREWLESVDAPPPDVATGDFNTPRGSYSIAVLFPTLHHAYDDGGTGYAATYHQRFPLYHIDHVLLANDLRAATYAVAPTGLGRHRIQKAVIVTR